MVKKIKEKIKYYIFAGIVLAGFIPITSYAEDDIKWHIANSEILSNHDMVKSALRSIAWGITKLFCKLVDVSQVLYDKTFGMIDLTNYGSINRLIFRFRPVLAALIILCVLVLGIILMVTQEKRPVLRNIIMGILVVSCSTYMFSVANSLVTSFKGDILTNNKTKSESYKIVNDNVIDLIGIDKKGNISNLNYSKGKGILHNAGIKNEESINHVDITEVLDWDDEDAGQKLYNWSSTFQDLIKRNAVYAVDDYTAKENYSGIASTQLGNNLLYRYSFDFWSCCLQLGALLLLFVALSYKNVRIAYELVVGRILAFFFSADVGNGERLKQILYFIRDTYIALCVSVLCVRLFQIGTESLTHFGIIGLAKGLVSVFIAYTVIDGPNIVERIIGIDAGLSSSVGRTMAIFGMVKGGTTAMASGLGKEAKKAYSWSRSNSDGINGNTKNNSESIMGNSKGKKTDKEAGGTSFGNRENSGQTGFTNAGASSNTGNATTDTSFMTGSKGVEGFEQTGTQNMQSGYAGAESIMGDKDISTRHTIPSTGASNFAENTSSKSSGQRVSNDNFKNAINRLKPSADASEGEKKDFNKQINNIVRGNHQAIKPEEGAKAGYKKVNYEKALEIAKAYHSINDTKKGDKK